MAYLYFDESIRNNGEFIIGALVISEMDLSKVVREKWFEMGLNPYKDEYKSSSIKVGNGISVAQRSFIRELLSNSELALVVLPADDRRQLGNYCSELIFQLLDTKLLNRENHVVYVDENIQINNENQRLLKKNRVECVLNSNSSVEAGIQLSDHASHALGGMLLEEMGVIKKQVRAGENSGYHPDEMLDLGFELWASLRYSLLGKQKYIEGLSPPPDDPANPFFQVDGYGLYIAKTCSESLSENARKRFGVNYLGCIH